MTGPSKAQTMPGRLRHLLATIARQPARSLAFARMLAALGALSFLLACAATAMGAPVTEIVSTSNTTAMPGSQFTYFVAIVNSGNQPTPDVNEDGIADEPRVITITLPQGITGVSASSFDGWDCSATDFSTAPTTISCTNQTISDTGLTHITHLNLLTNVDPAAPPGPVMASFHVTGGGAAPTDSVDQTLISPVAAKFGIDSFDGNVSADAVGDPDTQAGGHPDSITTAIFFNTLTNALPKAGATWPVEPPKDVLVDLPPGFVGNPTATGESLCTLAQLSNAEGIVSKPLCPPGSQVGVTSVFTTNGSLLDDKIPVFNLVAPTGVPARFGFSVSGTVVTLDGAVRSSGDYGLSVNVHDVSEALALAGTRLTFWGVPSDPSHDLVRSCPGFVSTGLGGPACKTELPRRAFLRNPTSCTAPGEGLTTSLRVDSWFHPGAFQSASYVSHAPPNFPFPVGPAQGITGCAAVPFSPSLTVTVDEPAAGAPSGYRFDITVPQSEDPDTIAEGDLKKIVTVLPEGVQVSPSSANGLGACSEAQIGFQSAGNPEPNPLHFSEDTPSCPDSSKLGEVEISTPLLEESLKGYAYLATPHENPFGSLLAMYLVVKGPGVLVKLPGELSTDPNTGRITTTFDHNPQLPVNSIKLSLSDGSRASLMNPPTCGTYTTEGQFSSWAEPASTLASNSAVSISTNANGEVCAAPGFTPAFTAGSTITQAGAFSPLVLSFSRGDSEQQLKGLIETLPPGASAILAGVPLCSDAEAASGSCQESSKIGDVTVASGPGPHPFYLKGQVYLTGPYNNAPYGEVVVVPADAGPFHLGNVVVRGSILINPVTAQATIVSDAFPQFVNGTGIPADVRSVSVDLDRPGFTFNPTNCEALSLIGSLSSQQGAVLPVSAPFHASGCAALAFHPSFAASTQGVTSKANGASLTVKVGSKSGPARKPGEEEANIAKVNVSLPSVLPSRLTTLQGACTERVFAANPATCPERSVVGSATASTPVLSAPLSGPAYLVSHGGAAFPDLVLILQGNGITVELTGHTQIKKGITYSNFETVPDAPISSFELKLPQGPHSVLTANKNLCALAKTVTVKRRVTRKVHGHSRKVSVKVKKLVAEALSMPTSITAQNGAVLKQSTRIGISGCVAKPAAKKKVAKKKKAKRRTGKGAKH